MKQVMRLKAMLESSKPQRADRLAMFAILTLGIVESVARGLMTPDAAVRSFFNSENGLFVQTSLRDKTAARIISHGAQLQDLFDLLPAREAHRELKKELSTIRTLCLKLLDRKQLVA